MSGQQNFVRQSSFDATGPRSQRSERGTVIVLTALSMTAVLVLAAFGINAGMSRSRRAQFQAAADSAALYATIEIRQSGATPATVTAKVRAFVTLNLGDLVPNTDAAWTSCNDPAHLPTRAVSEQAIGNWCISFDVSVVGKQKARVRLPMSHVTPIFNTPGLDMNVTAAAGADGTSGSGCDEFTVGICETTTTTTTTTVAPTTIRTTTTSRPATTTTAPPIPTTTSPATIPTVPPPTTSTIPKVTTTTARPPITTTTTTTQAPPTTKPPTTIDIGD